MKYLIIAYYSTRGLRNGKVYEDIQDVLTCRTKREAIEQFDWERRQESTTKVELFQRINQAYGLIREWKAP